MGLKCSRYLQLGSTKPFSDLFKDRTNGRNLFYLSTRDGTKTGVSSKPHLADLLFEIVFRSGGGSGIVRSLFECQGCLESSELISDGTASFDNSPELEIEILQLILTELTEMLCWCTGEGGDSLG